MICRRPRPLDYNDLAGASPHGEKCRRNNVVELFWPQTPTVRCRLEYSVGRNKCR
jgi:hypothetical protein